MMKWLKRFVLSILMLVSVALASAFSYEQLSRSRAETNYPPPGEYIAVGSHRLHALAKGSGSPTVIFESGLGIDGHLSWYKVLDEVASFTQAVSYDRAGVMWSERGENDKSPAAISAELKTMLLNGGFEPPYILVGHSLAGIISRPFIVDNQSDMAGVVFVDVSHPKQIEVIEEKLGEATPPPPALVLTLMRRFGVMRYMMTSGATPSGDSADLYSATVPNMVHRSQGYLDEGMRLQQHSKAVELLTDFGNTPLIVITGASPTRNDTMNTDAETREFMTNAWNEFQQDLLGLSSDSKHVLAMESAHYVQISEPEIVIESIRELVERWRSSQPQAKSSEKQ